MNFFNDEALRKAVATQADLELAAKHGEKLSYSENGYEITGYRYKGVIYVSKIDEKRGKSAA